MYDNRLPGIYYLYSLGSSESRLLFVRTMNLIAGIITLLGIYAIGKKLKLLSQALFITLAFATWYLGGPRLEGNIANNENFFLSLTICGVWFALTYSYRNLFISGILFGLSFIVKFNPFFTFVAIGGYIFVTQGMTFLEKVKNMLAIGVGFAVPIIVMFVLQFFNGNLLETIQFGLLNNTGYVTFYQNQGLTLETKTLLLCVLTAGATLLYIQKIIPRVAFLLGVLCFFDYYGALFSGRQYEHYLLQVVPPLALLVGYVAHVLYEKKDIFVKMLILSIFMMIVYLGDYTFYQGRDSALNVNPRAYYQSFIETIILKTQPNKDFGLFRFGQENKKILRAQQTVEYYNTHSIYFYANEPWFYDNSQVVPPAFFVTTYHQYFMPNGETRLVNDLQKSQPKIIAVDRTEDVHKPMQQFILDHYTKDREDDVFAYYVRETE